MSDLIDREDAINALVEKGQSSKRYRLGDFWELNLSEIKEAVESVPSAEPERTMKVEKVTRVSSVIRTGRCGNCGYDVIDSYKHCPRCGAKLDWSE